MSATDKSVLWKSGPLMRMELFSDAIFAIAITLLIIEIKAPERVAPGELAHSLRELWPTFLAYFISFMVIAIQWVDHRELFDLIEKCDRRLVWLNLLLLMGIAVLPFPTALVGNYPQERVAVVIYSGSIVYAIFMKTVLWLYAASWGHLVSSALASERIRSITAANIARLCVATVLLGLGGVWPQFSLLLWILFGAVSVVIRSRTK